MTGVGPEVTFPLYRHIMTEKSGNGAMDYRYPQADRRFIERVSCGEIVKCVDDQIAAEEEGFGISLVERPVEGLDTQASLRPLDPFRRRLDLSGADIAIGIEDLPVQVAELDLAMVEDSHHSNPRRGQVERYAASETAGSRHEYLGPGQLFLLPLPLFAFRELRLR
jgi:hypothetical protein